MIEPLVILGFAHVGCTPEPLPTFDLALLDRTLRRSLSEVTRLFMHTAKGALDDARVSASSVQVIFASAFGEIATAEALLAEAHDADGSSPARFRNSVHNTAAGLLSISAKNHLPCTALAAGWDTVAMGLIEAAATLQTGADRVLLVFAEERVPRALSADHPHPPLSVAMVLARVADVPAKGRTVLSQLRRERPEDALPPSRPSHPLGAIADLAMAIAARRSGTLIVGDGDSPWCVDVHHAEES